MIGSDPKTYQADGGDWYTRLVHQPDDLTLAYDLGGMEHAIVKWVTVWREKDGVNDLRKALHYFQKLIDAAEDLAARRCVKGSHPTGLTAALYAEQNKMPPLESLVVIYVCRWAVGLQKADLQKGRHYLLEVIHEARIAEGDRQ